MFASILNLVLGRSMPIAVSWRRRNALMVVSSLAGAVRRTTLLGCVLVFGGNVLHVFAARYHPEL